MGRKRKSCPKIPDDVEELAEKAPPPANKEVDPTNQSQQSKESAFNEEITAENDGAESNNGTSPLNESVVDDGPTDKAIRDEGAEPTEPIPRSESTVKKTTRGKNPAKSKAKVKKSASTKDPTSDSTEEPAKPKRFKWTFDMQVQLLQVLVGIKSEYEYKGLDFEADLPRLYSEVREKMSSLYDGFGPFEREVLPKDLTPEQMKDAKARIDKEKKEIKLGYDRSKQKVRDVRQDYRKAITEGRRSGSGRLIEVNWETLKLIWGGSPATNTLKNSINSLEGEENEMFEDEEEPLKLHIMDNYESQPTCADPVSDVSNSENLTNDEQVEVNDREPNQIDMQVQKEGAAEAQKQKETIQKQPIKNQFVDNKRKMLEKQLSANQRDQVYLTIAKDEFLMKQNMVDALSEATKESNKAFSDISKSIEKVGNSIESGLTTLALAIGGMTNFNGHPNAAYPVHQPSAYPMAHSSSTPHQSRSSSNQSFTESLSSEGNISFKNL
ncbi:DNA ligase 1-like [Clytia hemisphaerica]|uniref:DNA ligase 1-like n=1 Tax=Clytia hemisphaerica TaxID=252671 RepID=UPI0034D71BC5